MDPYLEGYIWPDVHNELASAIRQLLAPRLAPKYVARIDPYTVEDVTPESEVGITYPDVAVLRRKNTFQEPTATYKSTGSIYPPDVEIPSNVPIPVRIPVIEIRDVAKNRLITAIEILSPVNKKKPGLDAYREKRMDLHRAGVHLVEIDLLRRGTRPFIHPMMPQKHYIVTLMRAGSRKTEVWAFNVQDVLPILPIPLVAPDPDVPLDLKQALDMIYERGLYELSIDYGKEPPPPEFGEEERWMKS
jgi:hypothetical protein